MGPAQRLSEIHELPTLPEVVMKIRRLILSDEGDAASLARLIEQDPALSAKVLKVANSSFYGGTTGPITSVQRSVARIGFNEIGNIAMAISLIKKFSRKSNILDYRSFWIHCLGAANLASAIAEKQGFPHGHEEHQDYFLAGLLHDIGILLYDQFFHDDFEKIHALARIKGASLIAAETMLAPENTHAALGSTLLEFWKITGLVVDSVRHHHDPYGSTCNGASIVYSTHLAEALLCAVTDNPFEGRVDIEKNNSIGDMEIRTESIPEYLQTAHESVARAGIFFSSDA